MSDNQKVSPKKGFFKRNSFLIIFLGVLVIGIGILYANNNLFINSIIPKVEKTVELVIEEPQNNNKDLENKVANLESLIIQLSENIKKVESIKPESQVIQPQQNIIEIKDFDAYELLKSMNLILLNIDNQQIRNSNVTKLQSQFMFFTEQRLQTLLSLPDSSFSQQQLLANEESYMKQNFMNKARLNWLKDIIQNIFNISISRKTDQPVGAFITAIENQNYAEAVINYSNLTSNQKISFKQSYDIAKSYEDQKAYLENLF